MADVTAPTLTIKTPAAGATVSGSAVALTVTTADNVAVAGVQYKVDGANLGAEKTVSPYSATWDSTAVANGAHVISVAVRDAAGNTATALVNVTVSNATCSHVVLDSTAFLHSDGGFSYMAYPFTPTGTLPDNNNNLTLSTLRLFEGTLEIGPAHSTHSDIINLGKGRFSDWGSPDGSNRALRFSASDNTDPRSNGRTYSYCVPNADITAPTVSITAPSNNASVSGATVTVSATAADNVGVAGVQFKLDGANLGTEDTTSPYSISWNTTTIANGAHTLTAVARDATGNTTTSSAISVTINNADVTAPTVAITAPAAGITVAGSSVTVSATASDNIGVSGVQFTLDGSNLGSEDTSAPYSTVWDTTAVANGSHTLTAIARDAAGNNTTSAPISVMVNNVANCSQVALSLSSANVFSDSGAAYIIFPFGPVATSPDNSNSPTQSTLRLFENGLGLGPAHSLHSDIISLGHGRYSHFSGTDGSGESIHFSASDNTNPLTNGRAYSYCVPSGSTPPPTPSGLVGDWKLDEGSGTAAADSSSSANNGTFVGSPTWITPGAVGAHALSCTQGQYVSVPDNASLQFSGDFTVACWVKSTQSQSGTTSPTVLSKMVHTGGANTTNGYELVLHWMTPSSDPYWTFQIRFTGSVGATVGGTIDVCDGTWHHICGIRRGSTMEAWQDGALVRTTTGAPTGAIIATAQPLILGSTSASDQFYVGSIDEPQIYNRALSASEVAAIAAGANPPPPVTGPTQKTLMYAWINERWLSQPSVISRWANSGVNGFIVGGQIQWFTSPSDMATYNQASFTALNQNGVQYGVTDNFIDVSLVAGTFTNPPQYLPAWADDAGWNTICSVNLVNITNFVKSTGLKGIAFDTERFPVNELWNVSNPRWGGASKSTLKALVSSRGAQMMNAILSVFPTIQIAFLQEGGYWEWGQDPNYELWGDFYDGFVSTQPAKGVIVFTESTYPEPSELPALNANTDTYERNLAQGITDAMSTIVANPTYWKQHGSLAVGMWPTGLDNTSKAARYSPSVFKAQLAAARAMSGPYVWVYSKDASWWQMTQAEIDTYSNNPFHYTADPTNALLAPDPNLSAYFSVLKGTY